MTATSSSLDLPADFVVPTLLETSWCRLRPLAEEHAERDYAAVMETRDRLRRSSPNGWPREGFTLAENAEDLRRHAREFAERTAFAYTVLSPDETEVLGCVYVNPPADRDPSEGGVPQTGAGADVDVHLWVREREYPAGGAQLLHRSVHEWLGTAWPFERIRYQRPDYYFARGGCLCGAVEFLAGPLVGPFELCHCTRCRRASGSGFVAGIRVGEVRYVKGAALARTIELPIRESPPAYRSIFCERCGSPVPDPAIEGTQEIAAGTLDQLPFTPDRHIFIEHQAGWVHVADGLPRLTKAEIHAFRTAPPAQD